MKRSMGLIAFVALLLFARGVASDEKFREWYQAWDLALSASLCQDKISYLEEAINKGPDPGFDVFTRRNETAPAFFPYLRLAEALYECDRHEEARELLAQLPVVERKVERRLSKLRGKDSLGENERTRLARGEDRRKMIDRLTGQLSKSLEFQTAKAGGTLSEKGGSGSQGSAGGKEDVIDSLSVESGLEPVVDQLASSEGEANSTEEVYRSRESGRNRPRDLAGQVQPLDEGLDARITLLPPPHAETVSVTLSFGVDLEMVCSEPCPSPETQCAVRCPYEEGAGRLKIGSESILLPRGYEQISVNGRSITFPVESQRSTTYDQDLASFDKIAQLARDGYLILNCKERAEGGEISRVPIPWLVGALIFKSPTLEDLHEGPALSRIEEIAGLKVMGYLPEKTQLLQRILRSPREFVE